MREQQKFKRIRENYKKILNAFDAKGDYFNLEASVEGIEGLDFWKGGKDLLHKSQKCLDNAIFLYKPRFDSINAGDLSGEEKEAFLGYEQGVPRATGKLPNEREYPRIYEAITKFPNLTSQDYIQGMGEMFFDQVRVVQVPSQDYLFLLLEEIYRNIPDKSFLETERKECFLRKVVSAGLANNSGCARELAERYSSGDTRLFSVISELESAEKGYASKKRQVEEQHKVTLKRLEQIFQEKRKKIR